MTYMIDALIWVQLDDREAERQVLTRIGKPNGNPTLQDHREWIVEEIPLTCRVPGGHTYRHTPAAPLGDLLRGLAMPREAGPLGGAARGGGHEAEDLVGEAWYACPAELGGQVSRGERRSPGACGAVQRGILGGVPPWGGSPLAGFLQGCRVVFGAAVVEACFAGFLGHLVQNGAAVLALPLLVGEEVGEQDPAVPARLVEGHPGELGYGPLHAAGPSGWAGRAVLALGV
jgi:hypothetical protein